MTEPDQPRPNETVEPVRPNVLRDDASQPVLPAAIAPGRSAGRAARARLSRGGLTTGSLGRARLPGISGRWSALVLLALFVASAIVVPLVLHRALWLEAEVVIAVWFAIWAVALTWLGYAGRRVKRDWGPYRSLWDRLGSRTGSSGSGGWSWVDVSGFPGDFGGEGCGSLIIGIIVVVALLLVLYVTIGWVVPFVAIVLYTLVRAMLNRVGERASETRGNLPVALARGTVWAAVYTGPLALAVWAAHILA